MNANNKIKLHRLGINSMKTIFKHIFIILAIMIVTACGGGGDSENSDESRSGGVCFGSGIKFNCQGRVCTKLGNGVTCWR